MLAHLASVNWLAVLVCVVVGQIVLTIWFVPLFGDAWAKAYGGAEMTRAQHTKEIPPITYGIGALCVLMLSLGVAVLQSALGVETLGAAFQLAAFLAIAFFIAMAMPAYAFLRRWDAWFIGAGSQIAVLFVVSAILALWR